MTKVVDIFSHVRQKLTYSTKPFSILKPQCLHSQLTQLNPDSKVHGANMGPIWGRQDPGGPHFGPMNFAIWEDFQDTIVCS